MTPALEEAQRFLLLADADIAAFRVLAQAPGMRPAIILFHAQQAAEKCIKAVLFARGVEFRRTHDLHELAGLAQDAGIPPPRQVVELDRLSPYAVTLRYDDIDLSTMSTDQADDLIKVLRVWAGDVITRLGSMPS